MNTKQNIFLNMMGYTDFYFFSPKGQTQTHCVCPSCI